jgi:hypothetical protein
MLCVDGAYNLVGKEGTMAGHAECCRYEPSLEDLLDDEVMAPVLRSAGFDPQGFRDMMVETARRIDDRRGEVCGFHAED